MISIKIDAWDNKDGTELFNQYNGIYIPLLIFLDNQGNEIERVVKGKSFITLDAYHDEKERIAMEAWNLTALTVMKVNQWKKLFMEIGYTGDYYWFIP